MEIDQIIGNKYQVVDLIKNKADCSVGVCIHIFLKNKWLVKYEPVVANEPPLGLKLMLDLEIRGVPKVIDVFYEDGGCYYMMDYIRGMTLKEALLEERRSSRQYLTWVKHLAYILDSLHCQQIVHGDIKPDNIMILEDDSVVLIDFGSAFRHEDSMSFSPTYVAPERLLDYPRVDYRSDLYSLGRVMEEVLDVYDSSSRRLRRIQKALCQVDPDRRPKSTQELTDILNSYS